MHRVLPQNGSNSDDDNDQHDNATSLGVSDSVGVLMVGLDSDSSSDGESDDSESVPYIVDVAAVSASLARSMTDKGVQQTDAAKRVMLAHMSAATKQSLGEEEEEEEEECSDEEDGAPASEADEEADTTLFTNHSVRRAQFDKRLLNDSLMRAASPASTAISPRPSAAHIVSAWPALPPLATLPAQLSRPTTASLSSSGGITCRPAVVRPNTATSRSPRPATASSASAATSAESDIPFSASHSSSSLTPPMSSSWRSSLVSTSSTTVPPSSPPSLASLQLPVDCFGASVLTSSQHAILRGNFLSAARERRKQSKAEQQRGQSEERLSGEGQRAVGGESVEQAVFASPAASFDVSRASTAPSSASVSQSSLDSSSIPSSPSTTFRISPRSPVSPVSPPIRSRASSSSCTSQPNKRTAAVCAFPIQPTQSETSKQRVRQRSVRSAQVN